MRWGTGLSVLIAALALGGCTKEDVRLFKLYTFQLDAEEKKPVRKRAKQQAAASEAEIEKKAAAAAALNPGTSDIETGTPTQDASCQGEHIAYQQTKEYLKNFGPKPPDEPGEKGPCRSASPPAQ